MAIIYLTCHRLQGNLGWINLLDLLHVYHWLSWYISDLHYPIIRLSLVSVDVARLPKSYKYVQLHQLLTCQSMSYKYVDIIVSPTKKAHLECNSHSKQWLLSPISARQGIQPMDVSIRPSLPGRTTTLKIAHWTFSTASLYWNLLICYEQKNDLKLHKAGPRKLSPAPKFKKFWWRAKASTPSMLRMKPDASKDKESSCRVEISLKLWKKNRLAPDWGSNSTIITEIWRHPKTSKNAATHIQLFPKSPTRTSGVEFGICLVYKSGSQPL